MLRRKSDLSKRGFTLVEMLGVMVILSILVLIAGSNSFGYTKKANVVTMEADIALLTNIAIIHEAQSRMEGGSKTEKSYPVIGELIHPPVEKYIERSEEKEAKLKAIDPRVTINISSLRYPIEKYVIDIETGLVYHSEGIVDKDGYKYFGHGVSNKSEVDDE